VCGFCGWVGGALHWSEDAATPACADGLEQGSRQRDRLRRSALLNRVTRHYGVQIADWAGTSWILSHVTGETAVIDRLADLWPAVERMAKRPCDPLNPALLASLAHRP
jgi:hypothetical protein